ncbi:hypothetical protein RB195_011864 [Necator americanus]|uniref:Uncharacterized protein n=1 Tax=Necator americanus TaxID=51031 RepID=A0ABR1D575_NECAM
MNASVDAVDPGSGVKQVTALWLGKVASATALEAVRWSERKYRSEGPRFIQLFTSINKGANERLSSPPPHSTFYPLWEIEDEAKTCHTPYTESAVKQRPLKPYGSCDERDWAFQCATALAIFAPAFCE